MKKQSEAYKSSSLLRISLRKDSSLHQSILSVDKISVLPSASPVSLTEITTSTSNAIPDFENELSKARSRIKTDPISLKLIEFPKNEVKYSTSKIPEKLAWYSLYDVNSINEVNNLAKITIKLLSSKIEKCTLSYEFKNYDLPFIYMPKFCPLATPLYTHEICVDTPESVQKFHLISKLMLNECDKIVHSGYLQVYPPLIDSTEIDQWVSTNKPKAQFISLNKDASGTYYRLIYKQNEKNDSKWQKVLFLENCTGLKKVSCITQNAFQFNINEKIIIFVAPNLNEYQKWLKILSEASELYFEQDSSSQPKGKEMQSHNLQETLEKSSLPKLKEYSKENEVTNQNVRKEIRYNLFDIYQNILDNVDVLLIDKTQDFFVSEKENQCVLFDIKSIKIPIEEGERYRASFALFNVKTYEKLTEDFIYHFSDSKFTHTEEIDYDIELYSDVVKSAAQKLTGVTANSCVFNLNYPVDDVFIIGHFYKSYTTTLNKLWNFYTKNGGSKEDKKSTTVKKSCNDKAKKYSMLIGFSFRKLNTDKSDSSGAFSPLIKYDSRYTLQDICEIICEITSNKGCLCSFLDIEIKFKLYFEKETYPRLVTTALEGIQPFKIDCNSIVREIENLSTTHHNFYGFPLPINILFIELISTNMANIKPSIKMKNFCVTVEVCDIEYRPLPVIFARSTTPGFVKSISSDVIFSYSTPSFIEEFKILLPSMYVPDIHILFSFQSLYHEEKADSKKSTDSDHPFGYTWIKLFSQSKVIVSGEHNLPILSSLPSQYLSYNLEKLDKPKGDQDLKFIDHGGKPIFKFNLNVHTNYHSSNSHLLEIINLVNEKGITDVSSLEIIKLLKVLESLESSVIVTHLYVILHFLFFLIHESALLQMTDKKNFDDIHKFCVRVILRTCGLLHHKKRETCLKKFIQYYFDPTFKSKSVVIHHVIIKHLHTCFHHSTEPILLNNLFACSWFFLDVLVKCFAVDAISKDRITENRKNLLEDSAMHNLKEIIALIAYMIKDRAPNDFVIAKNIIKYIGLFITRCFSIIDRGLVMSLLDIILFNLNGGENSASTLKFELLVHIVNNHNFIPLNLPIENPSTKNAVYSLRELSDEYTAMHFPLHILLVEVDSALSLSNESRKSTLLILANLLMKHYFDDRYNTPDLLCRIHMLYLPFITMIVKRYEQLIDSSEKLKETMNSTAESADTFKTLDKTTREKKTISQHNKSTIGVVNRSSKFVSVIEKNSLFDVEELRQIFIMVFQILKCVNMNVVFDYLKSFLSAAFTAPAISSQPNAALPLRKSSAGFIEKFMIVLRSSIHTFGFNYICDQRKSITESPTFLSSSLASIPLESLSKYENFINVHRRELEINLQNEMFMIVLDIMDRIYATFKNQLEYENGDNQFMKEFFNLILALLKTRTSIHTKKCLFMLIRQLLLNSPNVIFKGRNDYCYQLCIEIFHLLNVQNEWLQDEAKYLIYLLLRCDYCYNSLAYHRSYISIIKACNANLNECNTKAIWLNLMKGLWELVKKDGNLSCGEFAVEISDLSRRVRNIIRLTLRFDELKNIPECLIDGHCSIANSFSEIPELTQLWMEKISDLHEKYENFSEAAICHIHVASIISVILKRKGILSDGPGIFKSISPIIAQTTVSFKEEALSDDNGHTIDKFVSHLKKACELFFKGERYELILVVGKIILPLLEKDNNYKELSDVHTQIAKAYDAIIKSSDKRFLGTYYRVLFLGQSFREDHGCEYIYKEPKLTTLPEIVERLRDIYLPACTNLQIIQESGKVKWENLDQNNDYIQVNAVKPHNFDTKGTNLQFLSHHNIDSFILETPFCLSGKAHGSISDQCKRITIFKTAKTFPFIKKRIPVAKKEITELTPIQVAIEEMTSQVAILRNLAEATTPNKVQLELKLQGSVSVTVNAGPIAYANSFLKSDVRQHYPQKHVAKLSIVFKEFLDVCEKAMNTFEETIVDAQIPIIRRLRNDYETLSKDILELINMETKA